MQYQKYAFFAALVFSLTLATAAQQPAKVRKPAKNPPQYPNIIDLEGQSAPPAKVAPPTANQALPAASVATVTTQVDPLIKALESLSGEVRTLVGELRFMNLRQQAQIELSRLTRIDLRIDHFERELKPVRERIAALEAEDQQLSQLTTRDSLYAQTATIGTIDREATMRQIKQQHEYRLGLVRNEKDRLKQLEDELAKQLATVRSAASETEQRLQQTEADLKRGNN